MAGYNIDPPTDTSNAGDSEWLQEQLNNLAEAVDFTKLIAEITPAQLSRLLREIGTGRDWRNGGWR